MIILIGKPFNVSIKKTEVNFDAVCVNDSGIYDKYTIEVLSKGSTFNIGSTFEVEQNWFDENLTKRKITYYEK